MAQQYKNTLGLMNGRAAGRTCMKYLRKLNPQKPFQTRYNSRGGGCGASMRSSCIGLAYNMSQIDSIIEVSIEGSRMTHHSPIGFLGGVVAALFTRLALDKVDPNIWMAVFFENKERIKKYLISNGRDVENNTGKQFEEFFEKCEQLVKARQLSKNSSIIKEAVFPKNYDLNKRYQFYLSFYNNWPGSNGCDSVLIAYDAILGAKDNWNELCLRAMLHGGDSDSTGTIAGAWYGAQYGFQFVPKINYQFIEDYKEITMLGQKLFNMYQPKENEREIQKVDLNDIKVKL